MKFPKTPSLIILIIIFHSQLTLTTLLSLSIQQSTSPSSLKLTSQQTNKTYKFLFTLSLPSIDSIPGQPLNTFNYKNIVLSNNQIVFFNSKSPLSPSPDTSYNTADYIYTILYDTIELPCLNRNFICTHNQFTKEYRPIYPEFQYEIPQKITSLFNNNNIASNNCIVLIINGLKSNDVMDSAAWICHEAIKELYQFQNDWSSIIREFNGLRYEFPCDYVFMTKIIRRGYLAFRQDGIAFKETTTNKEVMQLNFNDIKPYAVALYGKEMMIWNGDSLWKPEEARCFRIQRNDALFNNYPDYFCIYFDRNDKEMRYNLDIIQSRFLAEMYANRINIKLQKHAMMASMTVFQDMLNNKNTTDFTSEVEIDSSVLDPIKNQIRADYFIARHQLLNWLKTGEISTAAFESGITDIKEKLVNSVCNGNIICIKLMNKEKDAGLLPLNGYQEKLATDIQNPFNSWIPKQSYHVTLPKGGDLGRQLLMETIKMIQGGNNEDIEGNVVGFNTPFGEWPNDRLIRKAFNTFKTIRSGIRIKLHKLEEIGRVCRTNSKQNAYNLKRKIGLLQDVGNHDAYFEYFRTIRDVLDNK